MAANRSLIIASLSAIFVAAIGLAAGVLDSPARLWAGTSGPLSSAQVALPTIVVAGLADGINFCAFTLLLLFIATITSMYRGVDQATLGTMRVKILLFDGVFVLAIFLTYLTLGTGLLKASTALTQNHLASRAGALASVFLGLWMLKDYFLHGWGPSLRAPAIIGNMVSQWGQRVSLTAMSALGILVGLCTVPCSGAVYLAIISLLALQESFVRSYLYLVVYNAMFIAPLAAILAVASARPALNRLAHWNLHHREGIRLALGGGVTLLGLAILATV
ncbi:MAG: hypothetical protein HY680_06325 [Chloroflexi bacterium]|nr:hypothetical protein [Chloroflexota bacterium]